MLRNIQFRFDQVASGFLSNLGVLVACGLQLATVLLAANLAHAQLYDEPKAPAPQGKPSILKSIGIDQKLNDQVPLDLKFRDEAGREVQLGQYFGSKPVILTLVYYTCPMLCNEVQSGLASSLALVKFNAGEQFEVVAVSINPHETPADAENKKRQFLRRYKRAGAESGLHFLTGDQASIDALAKAVGFRYSYDAQTRQYAHASAIMVLTPQGRLAQYFYGIEYGASDVRLALVESSQNKIGNAVDQVLLYCFHYDPATGHYGAMVMNIVRLGGVLTVLLLALFVTVSLRREARRRRLVMPGHDFSHAMGGRK
jgi:protein SCO1/2